MRRWVVVAVVAVAAVGVLATAVTAAAIQRQREREARLAAIDIAEQFAIAWETGDWERLDALVHDPEVGAGAAHAQASEALRLTDAEVTLADVAFDGAADEGGRASYAASFTVAGLGEWDYAGDFGLVPTDSEWVVEWTPATLHPDLADGQRLERERHWLPRAPLLDRHGADLSAGPFGGLAGSLGEATAEQLEELGVPYLPGDVVGQSGMQRSLERRLAGDPGGEIRIVAGEGEVVKVLQEFPSTDPQPVRTTLDPAVQGAGSAALAPIGRPSALVAVDVPTGEVRAAVNSPVAGFDRALSGRYPPGSTFKVVTTAALLAGGLDPAATVQCPGRYTVGGRSFRNAGFSALGPISFREAFAESCNTAFVSQAEQLPEGVLETTARLFGFNVDYDVGVPVADARFPEPTDAVDHVAASIGQGRVEATPLHMASVAAAVARGQWVAPRILVDEPADPVVGEPLPAPVAAQMADLMRHAVAAGTGTEAQVPGEPVAGKTGTAEFGAGSATHAWFIAYRGDLAIAVLVDGGGFGGAVAAPAAARFFTTLG
ncbi:MAG TPA: penicillin-binding transpeptidase domain-containing protein [Egibacteraceae bacterium]|nr:penicillin-binding transpeptidase domain-containing protein [Egibacteraceae bacterium]